MIWTQHVMAASLFSRLNFSAEKVGLINLTNDGTKANGRVRTLTASDSLAIPELRGIVARGQVE